MRGMNRRVVLSAVLLGLGLGFGPVLGLPQNSESSPALDPSTALPSSPPAQPWCPSQVFCPGELLHTVNLARIYPDSKTFIDKPTNKAPNRVLTDFSSINGSSLTRDAVQQFVNTDFSTEGLELGLIALPELNPNPAFLDNVKDPLIKAWSRDVVHSYWPQLIRKTNESALCNGVACESTFIPLNHTFVISGGRYREVYYWDSFWIVEGLIQSELYDIVNSTLQNFMDQIERFGFIPNGGRIYYLDRSQPPLFTHMLDRYVKATNDTSILNRALPLAERELQWWSTNRTVSVTSSYTSRTYSMFRYAVSNSAPRPESYVDDYETVLGVDLTEQQSQDLFAELATGAESGWDYTGRFLKEPLAGNSTDQASKLRTLDIRNTVPVDLNSILYGSHRILADYFDSAGSPSRAATHHDAASKLRDGILDLFWSSKTYSFYDYNLTSNARNGFYTPAAFYPFWVGIIPPEVLSDQTKAFSAFSSINMVLNRYNGTIPSSLTNTGLKWDMPNAWPPHQYIALQALRNLPSNLTTNAIPPGQSYNLIPSGQLGIPGAGLPPQPIRGSSLNAMSDINKLKGTVVNGGLAKANEGWGQVLQRQLANRYIAAVYCSWVATGGSIPSLLPTRLQPGESNSMIPPNITFGNMFDRFSSFDVTSGGDGGENILQAGFGWTNGVVLWVVSTYGDVLVAPKCPNATDNSGSNGGDPTSGGGAFAALYVAHAIVVGVLILL